MSGGGAAAAAQSDGEDRAADRGGAGGRWGVRRRGHPGADGTTPGATRRPQLSAASEAIAGAWPNAVTFEQLTAGLGQSARARLGGELLEIHAAGVLNLPRDSATR